ncbi:MAG: DegT/DnrJ/EryC1/StrS family aminotransferase [Nitrospira sp.]|nr:DegT/DnrJ/EryC1/StrS family aminotransferase [bacterium]MBL7048809.1 DegT/DnrJ/EryC1/StrS family aminotransferase [Nitrospira sp.]
MTESSINKKPVQMIDLKAQYLPIKEEIKTALKDIIESGQFILGQNVSSFESEVANYHNVSGAVSLASGTDALHLSLDALGIKEGDEVITTPFTFIASAEAITYVGAKPVFADIDEHTLNIDPSKIEEKITDKTRAIVVVHLFGLPADMTAIMAIAKKHDLKIIEDSAQAFGAKYKGKAIGSIGDAGCFSFYPSKNLGAYGDGGMMISGDPKISERVKLLRNHGTVGPYQHDFIGYNSRLDEIQAAILRIKMRQIDVYNEKRRAIAEIYTSILQGVVRCPATSDDSTHVYHQYTIRTPHRDKIKEELGNLSISSVVYYPRPLHLQGAFGDIGHSKGDFPVSELAASEVLSLPIYPELEHETAREIGNAVLEILKSI